MNNRKIGVFDSGVGGLTVLQQLKDRLPNETFIYIGDNLHSPYGEKTIEQLRTYTANIIEYFVKQDVKMVILACNTTSCTVLSYLREKFPQLPMIGVIDATVSMVKQGHCQKIAIMATQATIHSQAYQKQIGFDKTIGIACPKLVPYIENGASRETIREELHSLLDVVMQSCDGVVLGCTHYPIIASDIHDLYPQVTLYSSSDAVVDEVCQYLKANRMEANHPIDEQMIYTTGDLEAFKKSSNTFFKNHDFKLSVLNLKVA